MSLGVILLVHDALDRAGQVARIWAQEAAVVIHVDARVDRAQFDAFREGFEGLENVRFAKRYLCEWGKWGLVAATLDAAEVMLRDFPSAEHVFLASGSCLPLRPVSELTAFLEDNKDTDFIESFAVGEGGWTKGGLEAERFSMSFPFSWKRQRWLFDRSVQIQRALGVRRALPRGLSPFIGSQWWCLTRPTLEAILQDPDRGAYDRFFKRVWIPDESYFQTLARKHARQITCRSLTLSRFDDLGKPHVFYDDHVALLARSGSFVARKIWPGAERIYQSFPQPKQSQPEDRSEFDRMAREAVQCRRVGRAGLIMQSCAPHQSWEGAVTASRYGVFYGYGALFDGFEAWLAQASGARVHGHLFAPKRVGFEGQVGAFAGGLSDSASLRDRDPRGFLTNLIWNTQGERQAFQFGPEDMQEIAGFLAWDMNAEISVISGAWVLPLYLSGQRVSTVLRRAAKLQAAEMAFLEFLRASWCRADVTILTLADVLEAPELAFEGLANHSGLKPPALKELSGFAGFVQEIKNGGVNLQTIGDLPVTFPQTVRDDAALEGTSKS